MQTLLEEEKAKFDLMIAHIMSGKAFKLEVLEHDSLNSASNREAEGETNQGKVPQGCIKKNPSVLTTKEVS
jgi:hypothetical protein